MIPVDQTYDPSFVIESRQSGSPWGYWWTTAFGIIIAATYLIAALLPAGFILAARYPQMSLEHTAMFAPLLKSDGFYLAIASLATAVICSGLIFLFVMIRRGITVSDYLGLKLPRALEVLKWLGVAVVLWALCDTASLLLKRDVVPDFMIKAYISAGNLPLFWLGIVVAAPLFEELFFRGFLFAGWSASRLGPISTILLTAVLWASIHQQYDAYDIFVIGLTGVLLGLARFKTGSLYTPILMHCLQNFIATVEVSLFASRGL